MLWPRAAAVDFFAIQQEAYADGISVPSSTLAAMLQREEATQRRHKGGRDEPPLARRLPARRAEHSACSTDAPMRIMVLPDCVLIDILAHLDARTLWTISSTSRDLAALAHSDELWRLETLRRYTPVLWAIPPDALTPANGETWRERYYTLSTRGPSNWRMLAVCGHNTNDSCWIVIGTDIYDVTTFMHRHPGMAASLLLFGGTDATEAFDEVPHSAMARRYMHKLRISGLSLEPEGYPVRALAQSEVRKPSRTERLRAYGGVLYEVVTQRVYGIDPR